ADPAPARDDAARARGARPRARPVALAGDLPGRALVRHPVRAGAARAAPPAAGHHGQARQPRPDDGRGLRGRRPDHLSERLPAVSDVRLGLLEFIPAREDYRRRMAAHAMRYPPARRRRRWPLRMLGLLATVALLGSAR